jgi:hypothetical protein
MFFHYKVDYTMLFTKLCINAAVEFRLISKNVTNKAE